ncbi:MAG: tol-pal system protein YbgF [Rhizomicrobium sp.]|nr:tol-pal system protein YbgF [Rhizomicrobium sp.]
MHWKLGTALAALLVVAHPAAAASAGAPHAVEVRGLFGESDEEKAARLKAEQRENDQDAAVTELRQRVQDLENALRQSTGLSETLQGQVRQLTDRLETQRKDFDYKLCTLSAQILGAAPAPAAGAAPPPSFSCDGSTQQSAAATAAPAALPSGGTLGSLPAATAPADATRSQYDEAMNLVARARYDEARAAFRGFADANPKDPLAPQAIYWVGNISYVQKDYTNAAQAFAEQIKKYPTSTQGAESMLKLGLSLIGLGEKKEGCLTLGAIKGKYKQAPPAILTQAANGREKFCPK